MEERAHSLLARLHSLPPRKITPSAISRLSKLIRSEIRFIHSLSPLHASALHCTNLGYLEAVVQVVQDPSVDAVSVVFQTFKAADPGGDSLKGGVDVHVDIVCTFRGMPVWIVVSDRNPRHLNWFPERNGITNWRSRVKQLLLVARSLTVLQPRAVLFCFARGAPNSVFTGFMQEAGASLINIFEAEEVHPNANREAAGINVDEIAFEMKDEGWVSVVISNRQRDFRSTSSYFWTTFKVDIDRSVDEFEVLDKDFWRNMTLRYRHMQQWKSEDNDHNVLAMHTLCGNMYEEQINSMEDNAWNEEFMSFITTISQNSNFYDGDGGLSNLVNLDTTALIAIVSEISNGAASSLVNMCLEDLVSKFKNTAQFMKDQAVEELKMPLMKEMKDLLDNKRSFLSESVCKEFKSLVSLCAGAKEKRRAQLLLKYLPVVPDTPSIRLMDLPETGNIKLKNKVVFGTGDYWQAPTVTANLSFVRAVRQTGMALSILEHKPRALMGEKCS